jgi:hypothetical protein
MNIPTHENLLEFARCISKRCTLVLTGVGACAIHSAFTNNRFTKFITYTSMGCIFVPAFVSFGTLWLACSVADISLTFDGFNPFSSNSSDLDQRRLAALDQAMRNLVDDDEVRAEGKRGNECPICLETLDSALQVRIRPVVCRKGSPGVGSGESSRALNREAKDVKLDIRPKQCTRCPRCTRLVHASCVSSMIILGRRFTCPTCSY